MPVEYVVAGLGNPGDRYARTRHNLGFRAVEALVAARHGRWGRPSHGRRGARVDLAGHDVLLVEPMTYMNRSGDAIASLLAEAALPLERLLVVCDDITLPHNALRLRAAGSDSGHNSRVGSTEFPRLRLGVGPVPPRVDPAEFVLAEFLPEEEERVAGAIEGAIGCVEAWVIEGIARAMSRFNTRRSAADGEGAEGAGPP
jgi:PTH1 family peptidyl-tRNA hydrolase